MTTNEALFKYVVHLGDNALIQGHRLGEWCSKGPYLEEDLALTNLALDNIGRAQAFLAYAAEIEGEGRSADDLAYKRPERQFYNWLITELPRGDFAYTVMKQFLFSVYEFYLYSGLCNSSDEQLAAISQKAIKEVRYHLSHSKDWCLRLGNGTDESRSRLQTALDDLWFYSGELFEMDEARKHLIENGVAVDTSSFYQDWMNFVEDIFNKSRMIMPEVGYMQTGSRSGIHTEHLGHLLCEMQYVQRAYPDAVW